MNNLGEYVNIKTGKLDANAANVDGQYPFFTCATTPLKINSYSYDCECVLVAGNGDLNVKYYNGKFDAYQRTYIIESKDSTVLKVPYLYRFLEKYVETLRNQSIGGVIKYIKLGNLTEAKIDIKDLEEQERIINILDKIDNLIEKKKQTNNNLDNLIKSRFIELFGDPVTNPMKWKVKSLSELGDCKNGMNFHKGESGIDIHCLGVGDFQNLSVITDTSVLPIVSLNENPSEEYMLQDGDIVFVRSNGNKNLVGRCLTIYPHDIPTTFSGFCIRYRISNTDKVLTEYLLQVLKHESMRQKMTGRGANIQNLNQQILSALQIPLPPIDLQRQFIEFVELTDKSKFAGQQSIETLQTLKAKLMQDCFG